MGTDAYIALLVFGALPVNTEMMEVIHENTFQGSQKRIPAIASNCNIIGLKLSALKYIVVGFFLFLPIAFILHVILNQI